ncbi:unnamed protein product [Strongylus vulgaris]|uniref:Uncharacterized protein n=1 Tax=Strongylus vulgaris TaxID=40348 RepID=A0A3P7J9A9_STRVU|nr:unnamed protein product [Strongylus vulgaris]
MAYMMDKHMVHNQRLVVEAAPALDMVYKCKAYRRELAVEVVEVVEAVKDKAAPALDMEYKYKAYRQGLAVEVVEVVEAVKDKVHKYRVYKQDPPVETEQRQHIVHKLHKLNIVYMDWPLVEADNTMVLLVGISLVLMEGIEEEAKVRRM